jgi:hypothetical protein
VPCKDFKKKHNCLSTVTTDSPPPLSCPTVINIMLFRKGLKDWAQPGIAKDYLVHLWDASLGAKVNLFGLLVE